MVTAGFDCTEWCKISYDDLTCADGWDCERQRPVKLEEVTKFGITSYCDATFESPQPIKQAMMRNAQVHRMLAGTAETKKYINHLIENTPVQIFFTPGT